MKCSVKIVFIFFTVLCATLSHAHDKAGSVGAVGSVASSVAQKPGFAIPYKPDNSVKLPSTGSVALILLSILAIAVCISFLLRRRLIVSGRLPQETGRHIRILDRQSLHGGHYIYLLDVDGERVLDHVGPQSIQLVSLGKSTSCGEAENDA